MSSSKYSLLLCLLPGLLAGSPKAAPDVRTETARQSNWLVFTAPVP